VVLYREWRHEGARGLMLEEKFFVEIWGDLCVISCQTPVIAKTPKSVFTEFFDL